MKSRTSGRMCAAAALVSAVLLLGCGQARPGTPLAVQGSQLRAPATSRVIMIVMENAEYGEVLGSGSAPYINALARRYAVATESFAVRHPSLPNYLALTSGSTHGISSDCTECEVNAPNIVDELEAAGVSWKAYLEGMPAPCFKGASAGGYAKKHNPFIYYRDIAASPVRCGRLVGFPTLESDLRSGSLPTYVWISPNLCDDGHDCGVSGGDRFLARTVPLLLREVGPHGFLLITYDEGSSDDGCCAGKAGGGRVATIVAGPDVRPGGRERSPIDHYGVLGTIEEALGVPALGGAADAASGRLWGLFLGRPRIR